VHIDPEAKQEQESPETGALAGHWGVGGLMDSCQVAGYGLPWRPHWNTSPPHALL
jgi:hypothetical protein